MAPLGIFYEKRDRNLVEQFYHGPRCQVGNLIRCAPQCPAPCRDKRALGGGRGQRVLKYFPLFEDYLFNFSEQGFGISCWELMVERGKACATQESLFNSKLWHLVITGANLRHRLLTFDLGLIALCDRHPQNWKSH